MHILAIGIGGALLFGGAGHFFDKAGEAINDTSTGVVKLAVTGAVIYGGYLFLKKGKVL